MGHVHVQTMKVIEHRLAALAEEICESQPHHSCHWNPRSEVTGRYSVDCPPICRGKGNYLPFSQFVIGTVLLLIFAQWLKAPIVGIISDLLNSNSQVRTALLLYVTI